MLRQFEYAALFAICHTHYAARPGFPGLGSITRLLRRARLHPDRDRPQNSPYNWIPKTSMPES